eukprot:CAMPEP_0178955128 /NCGR_PEP_ID=MMETSP0789-20121207/9415_1 /TAXON_ID=3005 /ORGANISM="Rhizosolenia setigera, Strain CCMP 1694" /LENGTH=347 /DNA_ID=CAMNT_0020636689 /DNA_START=255 /DNA_END=1298 /DNA_ORIENTATION=-
MKKDDLRLYHEHDNSLYHSGSKEEKEKKGAEKDNVIERISILGERNSGTSWIYEEMIKCFNSSDISVSRRLTRYKHWFQSPDVKKRHKHMDPDVNSLVIAMFRNPYAWVDGMRRKPHNSPEHLYLDWKEFVKKPWTMDRVGLDLELIQNASKTSTDVNTTQCQEDFLFKDINSCFEYPLPDEHWEGKKKHYSEQRPKYEMNMDGSGRPYNNILELRRDKILNHLDVQNYPFVKKFIPLQYETTLLHGTSFLIEQIEEMLGVKAKCSPAPPQSFRYYKDKEVEENIDFVKYLNNHIDWNVEKKIGYKKTNVSSKSKITEEETKDVKDEKKDTSNKKEKDKKKKIKKDS